MRLRAPRLLLVAVLLTVGWACGDTVVSVVLADRVQVEPVSGAIFVDETVRLEAQVLDGAGNRLFGRLILWSSDATSVADVDASGLVHGLSPGVATITASSEGLRGSAQVTVLRHPELELDPDSVHLTAILGEGPATASGRVQILNAGDGAFAGLAAAVEYPGDDAGWLEAAIEGDSVLVLTARAVDLEPGEYAATARVSASNAINSPVAVLTTLNVVRANPLPALTGISPDEGQREATLDVEATGDGFLEGLTTLDLGPQITVHSVSILSPTRLRANIAIGRDAAPGPRDVVVTNPAPGGGTAILRDGFTVEGENPFPTLQWVEPTSAHREETLDVTLEGSGFITDITSVDFGHGIAINALTVSSPTTLVANITVEPDAAAGARDVAVSNPPPGGGIATRPDAFTVLGTNPAPGLTSVAPDSAKREQTLDVQLEGTSFGTGYTSVDFGAGITVNSTTVASATAITANITIRPDAPLGPRAVRIINDEPGGGTASLDEAFTVLPGDISATTSSVSVAPDAVVADSIDSATITVVVRDSNGDPIGDRADGFEIEVGSSVIVSQVVETPTKGTYMFSIRSTLAQTAAILVAINGVALAEQPTVEFMPGPASGVASTLAVLNMSPLANGEDAATVTVTLADQYDNRVTGLSQGSFSIDLGGTSAQHGEVTHEGDGVYTFPVTNTIAEEVTVTVTVTGVELAQTPTITFVAGSVSATASSVSADPDTDVTADGTAASTVTIELRDVNGNPVTVSSGSVDLQVSGDAVASDVGGTATPGTYTATITNETAETVTVTVTVDGTQLEDRPTIQFVAGDISASLSSATADPDAIEAGESSTVTVALLDPQNNPVTGQADTFEITFTTGTATYGDDVTEAGTTGVYTFTVSSTTAGTVTVQIRAGGVTLDDRPVIQVEAAGVSAANSDVAAPATATVQSGDGSGDDG